jgi:hypothetical protein
MIENNAVPKIVDMIISDHEVMQNEALIALTLISALMLTKVEKILVDSKIGEKLVCLVKQRKPQKEVFENVLTLVQKLAPSSKFSSSRLDGNYFYCVFQTKIIFRHF